MPKFVVVSGGVVSGLGKGITASSVGLLLKESGLTVTCIKIDPYLNIDAGTMSPYEHGEVYVLDDGGEVDLDLGNYERFLDIQLTRDHNITTGKIYDLVLKQERKGSYLGKTVQVVPHITDAIQDWISRVSRIPIDGTGKLPDVCIIELGGTVGDIESMIFLEALRQFEFRVGRDNFCHIHVSLVPIVGAVGEQKSKPAQHSVKQLRAAGLLPNMIVCRATNPLERSVKEKISMFGMVPSNHVFSVHDVGNIYEVPAMLLEQNLPALVLSTLRINIMPPASLPMWNEIASKTNEEFEEVKIGIVGKYTGLSDSYISVTKALRVATLASNRSLKIVWINAEHLEDHRPSRRSSRPSSSSSTSSARKARHPTHKNDEFRTAWRDLSRVDGILCPGGFGDRATEGKILAVKFARQNNVPYLGICLGMQVAVIEFARNVLNMRGANSTEFDPDTKHPTVIFMPEISPSEMGGNMRLGSRMTRLKDDSIICALYDEEKEIYERHRHRYEVNPELVEQFEAKGMRFSGQDELGVRMEVVEIPKHKYFVGTQFHPEFKSRPFRPSPPFCGLIRAAAGLPITDTPQADADIALDSSLDLTDSLANLSLKSKAASSSSSSALNGDHHFASPPSPNATGNTSSTSDAESEASEERHQLDDLIESVISEPTMSSGHMNGVNGVSPKSIPSA